MDRCRSWGRGEWKQKARELKGKSAIQLISKVTETRGPQGGLARKQLLFACLSKAAVCETHSGTFVSLFKFFYVCAFFLCVCVGVGLNFVSWPDKNWIVSASTRCLALEGSQLLGSVRNEPFLRGLDRIVFRRFVAFDPLI